MKLNIGNIGIAVTMAALFAMFAAVGMCWIAARLWYGLKRRLDANP